MQRFSVLVRGMSLSGDATHDYSFAMTLIEMPRSVVLGQSEVLRQPQGGQYAERCVRRPGGHFILKLMLAALAVLGGQATASAGKIAVAGDEWGFSDAQTISSNYIANVVKWFGLGPGKKVLMLDGQSWNSGYSGTYGAFGSRFRQSLAGRGIIVTYRGYSDSPVVLAAYDAIFLDGLNTRYATLPADLANFVSAGGAVFVAGGTGTFPGGNAQAEANYWQPFFTAATGSSGFGLDPNGWCDMGGALSAAGPIGDGVTTLDWYVGQGVRIGTTPGAEAAMWSSSRMLVATWSSRFEIGTQPVSQTGIIGGSATFYVIADGGIPPVTYQWSKDGGAILDATNSTLVLTNLQTTNEGAYVVVAIDGGTNTAISQPASLTINSVSTEIALYAGVKVSGMVGLTYGIQATANLADTNSWQGMGNITLIAPVQVWYDSQPATQPRRYYRAVPGPIPVP